MTGAAVDVKTRACLNRSVSLFICGWPETLWLHWAFSRGERGLLSGCGLLPELLQGTGERLTVPTPFTGAARPDENSGRGALMVQ